MKSWALRTAVIVLGTSLLNAAAVKVFPDHKFWYPYGCLVLMAVLMLFLKRPYFVKRVVGDPNISSEPK